MQIALDAMVYLLLGVISVALLVSLAQYVAPTASPSLDEEALANKALECYSYGDCGTFKASIKNISTVEELLKLYKVPYVINYSGGEVVYVEREGSRVVIYG